MRDINWSPIALGALLWLLLVGLVGCGETGANYDVRIGALNPAQCTGYMHLQDTEGYWRCELIGGAAHADYTTPGTIFLNLETTSGSFSQVRAPADNEDVISGQIFIDGDAIAFIATKQQ